MGTAWSIYLFFLFHALVIDTLHGITGFTMVLLLVLKVVSALDDSLLLLFFTFTYRIKPY